MVESKIKLYNIEYRANVSTILTGCIMFSTNFIVSSSYLHNYYKINHCNNDEITYYILSLMITPALICISGYIIYDIFSNYVQNIDEIHYSIENNKKSETAEKITKLKFIFLKLFHVSLSVPFIHLLWYVLFIYEKSTRLNCTKNEKNGIIKCLICSVIYMLYLCVLSIYVICREWNNYINKKNNEQIIVNNDYKHLKIETFTI